MNCEMNCLWNLKGEGLSGQTQVKISLLPTADKEKCSDGPEVSILVDKILRESLLKHGFVLQVSFQPPVFCSLSGDEKIVGTGTHQNNTGKKAAQASFFWCESIKCGFVKSKCELCHQTKNHRESFYLFCLDYSWLPLGCCWVFVK